MLFVASYFINFFRTIFVRFAILSFATIFIVACGESSSSVLVAPQEGTGKLNDTGVVWGGDAPTGNNAGCTSNISAAQDCNQGRDAEAAAGTLTKVGAGEAGFDYTKLGESGTPLAIQDGTWNAIGSEQAGTKWSCVRDNVTGLIWEVKADNGAAGDKDNTYRWGGVGSDSYGTERYNDWNTLVNYANNEICICSFHDWKVPTVKQLASLVNYNQGPVNIDQSFFPNANVGPHWTSSASGAPTSQGAVNAWSVNFTDGQFNTYELRNSANSVRLVSAGKR